MKKMLLIPLILLAACQETPSIYENSSWDQERLGIVGGQEVAPDDSLSKTAFLLRRLYNRQEIEEKDRKRIVYASTKCTTSALTRRVVIAAAHCVSKEAGEINRVELKSDDGKTLYYNAEKVVFHPDYDENPKADVIMIRLDKELPEDIITVTLPSQVLLPSFTEITATGFGVTTGIEAFAEPNNVLRKTKLKVESFKSEEFIFTVNQTNGSGICSGDSGGPGLVIEQDKMILMGIASGVVYYKNPDGFTDTCNYLGEYVNVPLIEPWIRETLQELEAETLSP